MKKIILLAAVLATLFSFISFAEGNDELLDAVNSASMAEIEEIIENSDLSNLENYRNLEASLKNEVNTLLVNRDFESTLLFTSAFDENVFIQSINSAVKANEILNLINANRDMLNIDFSDFNSLTESSKINMCYLLLGKNFATIEQFESMLYITIKSVKKDTDIPKTGSSGSGGGDSSNFPISYYVADVNYIDENTISTNVTLAANPDENYYFGVLGVVAVYDKTDKRLIALSQEGLGISSKEWVGGRLTKSMETYIPKSDAESFIVKVFMLDNINNLKPVCNTADYLYTYVIDNCTNIIPEESDTVITLEGKIDSLSLDKTEKRVWFTYYSISRAAREKGWYIPHVGNATLYEIYPVPSFIKKGDLDLNGLQGLMLTIKIDTKDDKFSLVSAVPVKDKNHEVIVNPNLLVSKNDSGFVEYYKSADAKLATRIKLGANNMRVYDNLVWTATDYNSNYSPVQEASNLKGTEIEYRYVDTDDDGFYDTVYVTNEQAFVVGRVLSNKIFRNMDIEHAGTTLIGAFLNLDPLDDSINWSIKDKDGNKLEISDIQTEQVCNVRISADYDGYYYYDIIVTDDTIEGYVKDECLEPNYIKGIEETYYIINDKSYMLFDGISYLRSGDYIKAKIANNGKIIAYELSYPNHFFGVITATNMSSDFGDTYQLQIMTQGGSIEIYNLNERLNGSELYYSHDDFRYYFPIGTLVYYELNSDGEIKNIAPATGSIEGYAIYSMNYSYRGASVVSQAYSESSERLGNYTINDDTKIFVTADSMSKVNKNNTTIADRSVFNRDDLYTGYVIYNESKVALAVFLLETGIYPEEEPDDPITEIHYGLIVATNVATDFRDTYQLQLLKADGAIATLNLNERFNNQDAYSEDIPGFEYEFAKGTLVVYQLNSKNEIRCIAPAEGFLNGYTLASIDNSLRGYQLYNQEYSEDVSAIASYHISDSAVIFTTATNRSNINKNNVMLASKEDLVDGREYSGYVIGNYENEAYAVVLFETGIYPEEEPDDPITEIHYGLIVARNMATEFTDVYQLQMLKSDGTIATLNLYEKFNSQGTYAEDKADFESEFAIGTLVVYELNSKNEIKSIAPATGSLNGYNLASIDNSLRGTQFYNQVYREKTSSIGSRHIPDSAVIFTTETDRSNINKNNVTLSPKSVLLDDEAYSGFIISNDEYEAYAVVLFSAANTIRADSYPMMITKKSTIQVDGSSRIMYTGFVRGDEVQLTVAEDKDEFANYSTKDAILYTVNGAGEITNARLLASLNSGSGRYEVLTNWANDGTSIAPLKDYESLPVQGFSLLANKTAATRANAVNTFSLTSKFAPSTQLKGIAVAGKAYQVKGKILHLMTGTDFALTTKGFDGKRVYDRGGTIDGLISDSIISSSEVAYIYNGSTGNIKVTTIADLETDRSTIDYNTDNFDNDDTVYVYNYDGSTYFMLIVDAHGDN